MASRLAPWRIIAAVLLTLGLALLVGVAVIYATRRHIAEQAVTGWLRSRGITSQSHFEELGPGRLVGSVRIGPPQAPDLAVDRVEVRYSLAGLIAGRGVEVTSVRLVRPVLRARWQGGRFSGGALDPLIDEFRQRPATPGAASPKVQIDQGVLLLATDYGALRAVADARVEDSKLASLDATTAPAQLRAAGIVADLGPATLQARGAAGRLNVTLHAPFSNLGAGPAAARDGVLDLATRTSYPDLARPSPAAGEATVELRAASARSEAVTSGPLQVRAVLRNLVWTRTGGDHVTGDLRSSGTARALSASNLRLATAAADFHGPVSLGARSSLRLDGSAEGHGAWTGLGGPTPGDSAEIAAVKRGLRAFRVSAQGLRIGVQGSVVNAELTGPARLLPDGGGEVKVTPAGAGYRLTASGGGLPEVKAQVRRFVVSGEGAEASGSVTAALSIGPLQKAVFDADGALRTGPDAVRFVAGRCARISAARLELGQNDVEQIASRFCPVAEPLLTLSDGGWRLAGRAEGAAARVPFLQARFEEAAGQVHLGERRGSQSAEILIAGARVRDTAPAERFRPLVVSGQAKLGGGRWTAELAGRLPQGPAIGRATLRHEVASGEGAVEIATGSLVFAPGGLQPTDLSPLAKPLGANVEGSAAFTGGFQWTAAVTSSEGRLAITRLDFKSPAGQVSGLAGDIGFSSLAPLVAPPGQVLHAARVAAILPLTDVTASFGLQEKALTIGSAEARAGGGRVWAEAMDVPLEPDRPVHGVLHVDGVQLHDLVEASPFGDRVELDARVSGRLPLAWNEGKLTIDGGELRAIAPGRLSISRAALTSVRAEGAIEAPAAAAAAPVASTDTFTDFAYQAMENLAFDKLDAAIATRPDGRLGVLFQINGRHDPPQHQEITVSWLDLIRRKFLGRKLPLPSGTGVNLTLDTTLNLDDLLRDYGDFERLRGSPPVQP